MTQLLTGETREIGVTQIEASIKTMGKNYSIMIWLLFTYSPLSDGKREFIRTTSLFTVLGLGS